jgi:hypothetical protein
LPDATAFYSKLTSLSGPGEALSTDAVESGSLTEQFALANYGMRAGIGEEIYPAAADVQMSVTVNIQVTKVTGAAGRSDIEERIPSDQRFILELKQIPVSEAIQVEDPTRHLAERYR